MLAHVESVGNKEKGNCVLDLVEYDAGRLVYAEKANDGTNYGQCRHDLVVGDGEEEDIVVLDAIGGVVVRSLWGFRLRLLRRSRRGGRPWGWRFRTSWASHLGWDCVDEAGDGIRRRFCCSG